MISKLKPKTLLIDIAYDIVGSIFYALAIYTFAKAANFAPGGMSGVALIINYLIPALPIGTITLLMNIPLVIISYKALGASFLIKSFKTIVISTIIMDFIFPHIPLYTGDKFMAAIFSGLFLGLGLAIIYRRGSSTGGMDFLTLPIKKALPHYSIGNITLALDAVVFCLGGFVFGSVDSLLYGAVATIACILTIDKVIIGFTTVKLAIIVTEFGDEVSQNIIESTKRGATRLYGKGAYTGQEKDVILCSCSNREITILRDATFGVDPDAFVIIADAGQVIGEGFNSIHEII